MIGIERKTEVLGSGAFSTVSAEWDSLLGHAVAIKEINNPFAQNEAFTRAFLAKARRLFDLDHEHVLAIHRIDLNRQGPAIVRELGEETLEALVLAGPQPPEKVEEILHQALLGLQAMHARGVIHGAVKPQNLFRCGDRFKVGDFGVDGAPPSALSRFAPPEILRGEPAAAGSDLYSLGMVAYALLLGRERFEQISRVDLPPLGELLPGVPKLLAAAVEQMTRKALAYRAASAGQVLETLNATGVPAAGSSGSLTLGLTALDARLRPDAPKPVLDVDKLKKILAAAFALLVVGLGVWVVLYLRGQAPAESSAHPVQTTAAPKTAAQPAAPPPAATPAVSQEPAAPTPQPAAGSPAVPTAPVQESRRPVASPAPQPSGAVISQAPEEETPATNPAPEETAPAKKSLRPGDLIRDLQPGRYTLGSIHSGGRAYADFDAVFADVPGHHDRLPCIRTANDDRYKQGNLSFDLTQDAKVYVGHDQTIKRKPGWLQAFQRTGDSWSVLARDAAGSQVINFDVYERSFPKGVVTLGPNMEKGLFSALKSFSSVVGKREPGMYLVCVEPQ